MIKRLTSLHKKSYTAADCNMLAALKHIRDNWENNLTESMRRVNAAIENAEESVNPPAICHDLIKVLDDMVIMFIDDPLSSGATLTEEEEAIRRRALDVISRAKEESCHV